MRLELELLDLNNEWHLQFMFHTRRHPQVAGNLFHAPPATMEQHCDWLRRHQAKSHFIYLLKDESCIVCLPEPFTCLVGYCQCIPDEEKKEVEVGWVVHPSHHNKGYGKKAVSLLLQHVQEKYPEWKVLLEVRDSNKAAISIYERSGFSDVDVIRCEDGSLVHRMLLRNYE